MKTKTDEFIWLFCGLLEGIIRSDTLCQYCSHWSGYRCNYRKRRARLFRASRFLRLFKSRRPRRGRGLKIPPVWERWPSALDHSDEAEVMPEMDDGQYGESDLLAEPFESPESILEMEPSELDEGSVELDIEVTGEPQESGAVPGLEPPLEPGDFWSPVDPFSQIPGNPTDTERPLGEPPEPPGLEGPPDPIDPIGGPGGGSSL